MSVTLTYSLSGGFFPAAKQTHATWGEYLMLAQDGLVEFQVISRLYKLSELRAQWSSL